MWSQFVNSGSQCRSCQYAESLSLAFMILKLRAVKTRKIWSAFAFNAIFFMSLYRSRLAPRGLYVQIGIRVSLFSIVPKREIYFKDDRHGYLIEQYFCDLIAVDKTPPHAENIIQIVSAWAVTNVKKQISCIIRFSNIAIELFSVEYGSRTEANLLEQHSMNWSNMLKGQILKQDYDTLLPILN